MAMSKSVWMWIPALCGVGVLALSYVMPAQVRLRAPLRQEPQQQAQNLNVLPATQGQAPGQGQALRQVQVLRQEQACRRDEEKLVQLRATQARDELIRFERELGCERLRPQLLRLRESIFARGESGELAATQQSQAEPQNPRNDSERQVPPPPVASSPPPPAQPPPTPVAFEQALLQAANNLFGKARLEDAPPKVLLVIDPLIDGVTGAESNATQSMEKRIVDLVRSNYPRFEVARFSSASVAKSPVVLIGTFTAINNGGVAEGPRDAYRICLALADLRTKKIISKGVARARPEGIDTTPTPFFADSPVFAKDASTDAYIKSCQASQLGGPIEPVYTDRIAAASLISDAIQAYNARRYKEALDLYQSALLRPGGEQLRVL